MLLDTTAEKTPQKNKIRAHQNNLTISLQNEKKNTNELAAALKKKTDDLIKIQYLSFPKRFLLLLEGSESNTKKEILNLTRIFCNTKRKNILSVAFGCWKICLIENKSKGRFILYSKKAGAMLMKEWMKYMMKKMLYLAFKRCNLHLFDLLSIFFVFLFFLCVRMQVFIFYSVANTNMACFS